ncbi:hypothetical protein W97_06040 [Coniosporium apollinis CBS 100218]|uniref:Alpha-taxilin n=1 Tax=Coniosporium apollinis (strain CBS 100218) TaxID=1168221 RepID=R7YY09_CONA1|nr:uncharacterized protein W97_06040 [Coniosporium apollinis CBS 100218]EON66792.1 hypothetical protein W97_06040 [Coniosporium apollinis CBS 100218]
MSAPPPPTPAGPPPKKGKGKKSTDPTDASKQIAAKIAQLELDAAGEKDQEAEVDREVKKANRELSHMLSTMDPSLSRLEAVQKKYTELLAEMKRTEREHNKAKKRADQLQKEKDKGITDLNKATQAKDKLEKIARDFTKENKKLKEENGTLKDIDTRKRRELEERLERMVLDVEDVIRSREDPKPQTVNVEQDELFRQKFKSFVDQYELRELQFHSLLRTKDLEIQYQMARFEEQRKAQELESSRSNQLTRQVSTFSQTETELRSQLNIYVEKFKQQVEDTLNNSNDLFLTFRKEMEEMSKKTKRLEKENQTLTRKQDATNRNILEMAEERTRTQKEMADLRKKNENLEKLCRGMQAQGRGQVPTTDLDADDEGTESEYEYDDEDEDGSGEGEYDEDTEEEAIEVRPRPFGPVPPPPPPPSAMPNGKVNGPANRQANGQVNGIKH